MSACTCVVDNTIRAEQTDAAAEAARRDPTETADVRRRFRRDLERRFRALRSLAHGAITEQGSALGIGQVSVGSILHASLSPSRASGEQVLLFQHWFDEALRVTVLGGDGSWMGQYVRQAYGRALRRSEKITGRSVEMDEGKVRALTQIAVAELQGIEEAVSQRAVRAVGQGMLQSLNPAQISRMVAEAIDKVGVVRGRALVNSAVVLAHSEGTLDAFQASGVGRVGVLTETRPRRAPPPTRDAAEELVEVLTAGDDLVCEECEDIARDGPFTISEARGKIPAHPNCRCAFVPFSDMRFAHEREEDE